MTQPLNYATPKSYASVQAPYNVFHARGIMSGWKGDRLWRVYLEDGKAYFIKVGGSRKNSAVAGAQFGLLGALIAHWAAKRDEKKTEKKVNEIFNVHPRDLIGGDKESFVVKQGELTEMSIEPPTFWTSVKFGRWKFRDHKNKRRVFSFDDLASMQFALKHLGDVFGSALAVNVQWNEAKGKFIKAGA